MTRRFRESEPVDFVVVGSGAAGGVMARELAQAGFGVVVMEQGPRLEAQDFEHDELKYWFNYGITNDPARSRRCSSRLSVAIRRSGVSPPALRARTVACTLDMIRAAAIPFPETSAMMTCVVCASRAK